MNGIDIDLNAFAATRAELDRLAARQRAVDGDIAAAKRALASALRAGATADERSAGMAYWRARFAHADGEAARLLRDLAANYGRGRASWLVRTLTPINPLPPPDVAADPEFAPGETIAAQAKMTRAVLLPE